MTALLVWCGLHRQAAAAEPQPVILILEGGTEERTPLVLDLSLRDGRFDEEAWGAAYQYNLSLHPASVTVAEAGKDRWRLNVQVTIESDPFAPAGAAAYQIELTRQGDAFDGTFTGTFVDTPVKGKVTGHAGQSWVRAVPGFEPLQAAEHPRLIFRKKNVPELRRRMETPEGRAILVMLNARAPLRDPTQVTDRHTSWMAANWGAIWQLTGQKDAARKARQVLMDDVIKKPMPNDRKEIHHASRLLGIALTYDLCYDAWDEEFRRALAEYLLAAAADLASGFHEGFRMNATAFDPESWKHRNAIRMACVGCAALAILGDEDSAMKPLAEAERLARAAERHVLTYLRSGISQSGCGLEGAFYKDFALAGGVLQFLQASRVARGRDLSGANPFLLAGHVAACRLEGSNAPDFGLSSISIQASGLWPMGLGSAPREFLPALKWGFDRDAGLAGKQHFGCAYPYQAAYALVNYPFDVQAKPPGESLRLLITDTTQGHFLFRNRWQDANDILVELYLNLQSRPPVKLKTGDLTTGVLNVSGLGGAWIRGFVGPARLNDGIGAEVLYAEADRQQAFVGMDLTSCFTVEPERPGQRFRQRGAPLRALPRNVMAVSKPEKVWEFLAGAKSAEPPPKAAAPPKDPKASAPPTPGVRMTRHIAVDLSGACGAPMLIALVDRCEGLSKPWRLPLPAGTASDAPGRFMSGDPQGVHLSGRFVVPADARLSGGQLPGRDEYFVVLTLQQGATPAVNVEGAGLGAKVTVGNRIITFDGKRILLNK